MIISHISLLNFRNQQKNNFLFSQQVTIVIGKNASGKTNLIEAIYFLAIGKSFRLGKDLQTITYGREMARIKGEVMKDGDLQKLEVQLTNGEVLRIKSPYKRYLVNGVAKRNIDFVGNLKCVLFWPEDMELVTDSPSLRRHYLDVVLMQSDREYRRNHLSYERGLRQRNKLLEAIRENQAHEHQLMFWDQLLIREGNYISKRREEYIDFVNKFELPKLEQSGISFQIAYDKSVISEERLLNYKEAEIAAGVTLVGPHRDDMIFKFKYKKTIILNDEDYKELSFFGSRGEQRLGVLWLKLGELSFIQSQTKEKPVLLLDDIFSELDHEHREIIFDIIGGQQSILSVTDRHLIPEKYLENAKVIELE